MTGFGPDPGTATSRLPGAVVLRRGTVLAVNGDETLNVQLGADTLAVIPSVPFLGEQPGVNDEVWVALIAGQSGAATSLVMGSTSKFVANYRRLGHVQSATAFNHTTGAATLCQTLNVTIPPNLPPGTEVRVTGRAGYAVSPAGVGIILAVTNASGGQNVTTTGGCSGGLEVVRYDVDPPAGARAYTLTVATTIGGNTVTASYTSLEAEFV